MNKDYDHAFAMMSIVHQITAGNNRTTLELTVRERLVVQRLGLFGNQAIAVLGTDLGISASSMTSLIDRLELKGFLQRIAHKTDRRATLIKLTRKGKAAFARELEFYNSLIAQTLEPLGKQAMKQVLSALSFNQLKVVSTND